MAGNSFARLTMNMRRVINFMPTSCPPGCPIHTATVGGFTRGKNMATINAPANERRHIPERRSGGMTRGRTGLTALDWVAMILMIVGGLNWGLVGAFDVNLVSALFGEQTALTRLVYSLVGIASLWGIYLLTKMAAHKT